MSVIGYVRERGSERGRVVALLQARGCTSVHFEGEVLDGAVLSSVLRFLRPEDRLVVSSLKALGASPERVLQAIDGALAKQAVVEVLESGLSTEGSRGEALRAALAAADRLPEDEASLAPNVRASADDVRRLRAEGVSLKEISHRLGISRVTVWRKLKGA